MSESDLRDLFALRCSSDNTNVTVAAVRRELRAPDAQKRISLLLSGFSFTVVLVNVALLVRTRTVFFVQNKTDAFKDKRRQETLLIYTGKVVKNQD